MLADAAAAQILALTMCADLARYIVKHLKDDAGWQLSVSDENGKALYRVSVVAESVE
jgi:hypothetical protein